MLAAEWHKMEESISKFLLVTRKLESTELGRLAEICYNINKYPSTIVTDKQLYSLLPFTTTFMSQDLIHPIRETPDTMTINDFEKELRTREDVYEEEIKITKATYVKDREETIVFWKSYVGYYHLHYDVVRGIVLSFIVDYNIEGQDDVDLLAEYFDGRSDVRLDEIDLDNIHT
jgi:hypothetical protein